MIAANTPKGTKVRINGKGHLGEKGGIAIIIGDYGSEAIRATFDGSLSPNPVFLLSSLDYITKYKITLE